MSRRASQRRQIERHLVEAGQRLARAREELAALDEQVAWFDEATEDARMRALVTESPADRRELSEVERHTQAITRSRSDLVAHIERLRRLQDQLLEELPAVEAADDDQVQRNERVF